MRGVIPPGLAWLTSQLLLAVVRADDRQVVFLATMVGLGMVLVVILEALQNVLQGDVARQVRVRMQSAYFRLIGRIPGLAPFHRAETRDLLRLAQQSAEIAPIMALRATSASLQGTIAVGGFTWAVFTESPPLAIFLICATVPHVVMTLRTSRDRLSELWDISPHERRREFFAGLLANVQALQEIRIYQLSNFFLERMNHDLVVSTRHERARDVREALRNSGGMAIVSLAGLAGLIALFTADPPTNVAGASLALASVVGYSSAATGTCERWVEAHEAGRLFEIYGRLSKELAPSPEYSPGRIGLTQVTAIEFRDVWFRYSESSEWVLQGVSFTLLSGESTGLVGVNGAGKSTIVKLICQLYEPTRGEILLNGKPLREFDLNAYRARVSAVFQDFMAYDLTVRENIVLGDLRDVDDKDIFRVTEMVGLDDDIRRLPNGLDTSVSARFEAGGSDAVEGLSGGQWQRIAIARALLRSDRDILLLDEPASGLDPRIEQELRDVMLAPMNNDALTLLVSHRLSSIRRCKTILVLDNGVIVQRGTHDALMATSGPYPDLFSAQAEGYA